MTRLPRRARSRDAALAPVRLAELELSRPIVPVWAGRSPVSGLSYGSVELLVRLHGDPLGTVALEPAAGPISPARVASVVQAELGRRIAEHLRADGEPPAALPVDGVAGGPSVPSCRVVAELEHAAGQAPLVSVVVASFRRPQSLVRCVRSLLSNDHPNFEVVVVDNCPGDDAARAALAEAFGAEPRLRYVAEPQAGTSRARNRGIAEARGEVIAFADDDVVTDPGWISAHAGSFADPAVGAVAGLTHPLELETPAQVWFERFGGFARGHRARTFAADEPEPPSGLWPYTSGAVGAGGNFAARTAVLRRLGGFDTRLGPGTPTTGGEDLDLSLRVLLDGGRIRYEPAALARHQHRRDGDAVRAQVVSYGVGGVAMLTKWWLADPRLRRLVLRRLARIAKLAVTPLNQARPATASPPRSLLLAQLRGYLLGPLRWLLVARQRPEPIPQPLAALLPRPRSEPRLAPVSLDDLQGGAR